MIALIQRVSQAQVRVQDRIIGAIDRGVLAFLGVQPEDTESDADRLLQRLLGYRIFADDQGRMNRDVRAVGGALLLVSQFTLAADTRTGSRPGFTTAAAPERARQLFDYFVTQARAAHPQVATGEFGADMQVQLTNDGPVTFWLQTGKAHMTNGSP
jgi:D-tyrosyl-tRNA(Tyr) deacylase